MKTLDLYAYGMLEMVKKIIPLLIIPFTISLLSGCSEKKAEPKSSITIIESNGYIITKGKNNTITVAADNNNTWIINDSVIVYDYDTTGNIIIYQDENNNTVRIIK